MTGQHANDAASSATAFPFSWAVAVWFPAAAMGHICGEQGCRAVLTLITPGSVWCSVTRGQGAAACAKGQGERVQAAACDQ